MATQFMGIPLADDARNVQQSVIGLFDKPLVDRQFQDASIAGSKLYPSEFGVGSIRYSPYGELSSAYAYDGAPYSVTLGYQAFSNAANTVAIGAFAGYLGVSIGYNARNYSNQGIAIGTLSYSMGNASLSMGFNSYASYNNGIAIGAGANSYAVGATAIGAGVLNGVPGSVALGYGPYSINFTTFAPAPPTAATAKLPVLINGNPYSLLLAA